MPLTDRVAVIVGATGQLGPAVARALAGAGARLVLLAPDSERLDALNRELGFPRSRVLMCQADALDQARLEAVAEEVMTRFGRVDLLLHLSSSYHGGSVAETTSEVWEHLLDQNLRTAVNALRVFVPHLLENNWGRIVTISSGVTQAPPANVAAYVTAKSALETLTIATAQEVKDKNVTANVVLIRALDTPAERARQPEKKTGWVRPQDVAAMILFLCSDEGAAITGARIPVLGGSG